MVLWLRHWNETQVMRIQFSALLPTLLCVLRWGTESLCASGPLLVKGESTGAQTRDIRCFHPNITKPEIIRDFQKIRPLTTWGGVNSEPRGNKQAATYGQRQNEGA